jgi:hypothetical protein
MTLRRDDHPPDRSTPLLCGPFVTTCSPPVPTEDGAIFPWYDCGV